MRKLLLGLLCLTFIINIQAQTPKMVLKTNILPVLMGQIFGTSEYRIVYEQAMPETPHALAIGASYNSIPFLLNASDIIQNLKVDGYRIQLQYKLYIGKGKTAPDGFYISPHFSYNTARFSRKSAPSDYLQVHLMNINGLVGYQLITSGNFALDIFSGLGFKSNSADIVANTSDDFDDLNENLPLGTGPKFTLGFNFGLAF